MNTNPNAHSLKTPAYNLYESPEDIAVHVYIELSGLRASMAGSLSAQHHKSQPLFATSHNNPVSQTCVQGFTSNQDLALGLIANAVLDHTI